MDAAEFDRFADEYEQMLAANIAITGEAPEFFARYKIRVFAGALKAMGLEPRRVLDLGAGIGNSLPYFREFLPGAGISCADVSARSLEMGEKRFPGLGRPLLIEGDRIPAEDGRFDAAFSACVFHHILHEQHGRWLEELRRVVRPGGLLAVFEHNPLNPLTVRAVNTCPFDENARLIRADRMKKAFAAAGWRRPTVRFHIFFPRALSKLRFLENALSGVPLGAQYSVTAVRA